MGGAQGVTHAGRAMAALRDPVAQSGRHASMLQPRELLSATRCDRAGAWFVRRQRYEHANGSTWTTGQTSVRVSLHRRLAFTTGSGRMVQVWPGRPSPGLLDIMYIIESR